MLKLIVLKENKGRRSFACLTLDLETDFGGRTGGALEALKEEDIRHRFFDLCREVGAPVTVFAVASLYQQAPEAIEAISREEVEFGVHSLTHDKVITDFEEDLAQATEIHRQYWGRPPQGYRVPMGRLHPNQIDLLNKYGYVYDSSIFPAWRPGVFNNRSWPLEPIAFENGLVEFPVGAIPKVRVPVSISYIKLLGWPLFHSLMRRFGLPRVVTIGAHLHDFSRQPVTDRRIPGYMRFVLNRNRAQSFAILDNLLQYLISQGYAFSSPGRLLGGSSPKVGEVKGKDAIGMNPLVFLER